MSIRKFNGDNGKWAPVLTHVDAVIGWDGRTLTQILKAMQSDIDNKDMEDGDNVPVDQMEVGRVYNKDGKIYIILSTDGTSGGDYEAITIGTDGVHHIGKDTTQTPSTYDNLICASTERICSSMQEFIDKTDAVNTNDITGIWFIEDQEDPCIIFVGPMLSEYGEPWRLAFSYGYNMLVRRAHQQSNPYGDGSVSWGWYHEQQDASNPIWLTGGSINLTDLAARAVYSATVGNNSISSLRNVLTIPVATTTNDGALSHSDKDFINKLGDFIGGGTDNYVFDNLSINVDSNTYSLTNTNLYFYPAISDNSDNAGIIIGSGTGSGAKQLYIGPGGVYMRSWQETLNTWDTWSSIPDAFSLQVTGNGTTCNIVLGDTYKSISAAISAATSSQAGVMTASDKSKLDNLLNTTVLTESQYNQMSTFDANTLYVVLEDPT